jgi:biopolymer transport protein ExbD
MGGHRQSSDWRGTSLAEPFGFRECLRGTDTRMDFVPVLDMIVIAMLVSLLFTSFVTLPGVRVDLPVTEMRMQHSQQAVAVLTIGNNGMFFFNGAVFEPRTIQRGFEGYIRTAEGASPVLLVKAEDKMEMQEFLRLCEMARSAGFVQVQLAGQNPENEEVMLPEML